MSNLYTGPSIDASFHLAKRFQMRRILKKLTNQKQELPVVAMFVNESELKEQSLWRTFQGGFLPNFNSFGLAVSEEKIFLEINQLETRIACGGHVFNGSGRNVETS